MTEAYSSEGGLHSLSTEGRQGCSYTPLSLYLSGPSSPAISAP